MYPARTEHDYVGSRTELARRRIMARILITDDHAMMRKGLRTVIEPHPGWEICGEATTGTEALEQTKLLQPDLIVLDVSMPVLNGLEVAHRISKSMPEVKILLFTMHNSP
jgi:DNA-binding NarL/FixJ family response regulator